MTDILKGETIIYFGPEPWTSLWRNRHQLMSRFTSENDVWYVEPPVLLRQALGRQPWPAGQSTSRPRRLVTRDASGVHLFHSPRWLPITGRAPLKDLSIRLFLAALSRAARLGKDRRPILWLSRPHLVDYARGLNPKLTIYHVVDEYCGYGSPTEAQLALRVQEEQEVLRFADVVIVVTPTLLETKAPYNPNTHLVPNAVNFAAYAEGEVEIPDDLANIRQPVIGYSGLVGARLNLELLESVAAARPDWSYVFVGAVNDELCEDAIRRLRALPNVHFLGQKPVDEAPRYVRHFDVCMIPYADNLRAQHASPLKLYEYAAASKPMVATDFPAARAFEGHLRVAQDTDAWLAACEESLALAKKTGDAGGAQEIIDNRSFASRNTWEHRVELISQIVRNHLERDGRQAEPGSD